MTGMSAGSERDARDAALKITLTPDERRALLAAVHGAMDDMDTDDEVAPLASIVAKIEKARK